MASSEPGPGGEAEAQGHSQSHSFWSPPCLCLAMGLEAISITSPSLTYSWLRWGRQQRQSPFAFVHHWCSLWIFYTFSSIGTLDHDQLPRAKGRDLQQHVSTEGLWRSSEITSSLPVSIHFCLFFYWYCCFIIFFLSFFLNFYSWMIASLGFNHSCLILKAWKLWVLL